MWGWFGGSAAKQKDAPKEAILSLRQHIEMLEKRGRYLESQMEEQDNIARKNINSNKNAARAALKRKKLFETNLDKLRTQMETLESQVYSIEAANLNSETIKQLERASKAMKGIQKGVTVEKVDKTMNDIEESNAISQEIDAMMAGISRNNDIDEDELEGELEALEQAELDERITKIGNPPVDGDTFKAKNREEAKPQEEDEDEEEALRKLQMEMALS